MNPRLMLARELAMSLLWRPYLWGGDNPATGFDCSGLVIELLKSVGVLGRTGDWRARDLKRMWPRTTNPQLGCLAFYGSPATHVVFCLDDEFAIGADGGTSRTTDLTTAIKQDAYIRVRPFRTRPGLSGFNDPFHEVREEP